MARGRTIIIHGEGGKPPPQKPDNEPTVFRIVVVFIFIGICMWVGGVKIG